MLSLLFFYFNFLLYVSSSLVMKTILSVLTSHRESVLLET